jgi:uncharacterized membrane protein YcaP (DUF421 family)
LEHLFGEADSLGWVALKAVLLYLTAVFGFRLGERRTLSQLSPFDFVAAVAVGAIVGRVPNAHDASYLSGIATLAAVLVTHGVVTRLRQVPAVATALDRAPHLVMAQGEILDGELRRCGLTRADLHSMLRQQGIQDPGEVRFAVLEPRGQLSIIRSSSADLAAPGLFQDLVR